MNANLDLEKIFDIQLLPRGGSGGQRHLFKSILFEGWVWRRKREVCIAICLGKKNVTAAWLQQAGLLLAAYGRGFDAGLFVENHSVWLINRISLKVPPCEMTVLFEVQVAVAQVLTDMQ